MDVLVTGAAGFIGFHLSRRLVREGHRVVGLDNLSDYYDVRLKKDRLAQLADFSSFRFVQGDLADDTLMERLFAKECFSHVVNMAAQAGVRYSLSNPRSYIRSNIAGFGNVLEGCRRTGVRHLLFASSSSVYGLNSAQPYSVHAGASHPVSLYAATKRADELMAHSYSHLFRLPCTGLRFFTVYGPWGRPDMATHLFTTAIKEGRPITLFNHGRMRRDFTYIDDIIEGVMRTIQRIPVPDPHWSSAAPDPASSTAPWRLYNIGNREAVALEDFVAVLEKALGRRAVRNYLPMQPGDVESTCADVQDLMLDTGFSPATPLTEGIARFVDWHNSYYGSGYDA